MRRRNSDEHLRALERRLGAGSATPSDVIELARIYERLGHEPGTNLSRDLLRDAYWKDVQKVGSIVADMGQEAIEEVERSLRARRHLRPFPPTQILERQGGWIDIPEEIATAIVATRRLADSGSIRDVLQFSFRGQRRDMADLSAAAESAFVEDVVNEAGRILMDFPHPLGTRLRSKRPIQITTDEDRPAFEAEPGSLMTLVAVFPHGEKTTDCRLRTDDYWADWGDTIDLQYSPGTYNFDDDFEALSP